MLTQISFYYKKWKVFIIYSILEIYNMDYEILNYGIKNMIWSRDFFGFWKLFLTHSLMYNNIKSVL